MYLKIELTIFKNSKRFFLVGYYLKNKTKSTFKIFKLFVIGCAFRYSCLKIILDTFSNHPKELFILSRDFWIF